VFLELAVRHHAHLAPAATRNLPIIIAGGANHTTMRLSIIRIDIMSLLSGQLSTNPAMTLRCAVRGLLC
jgi:hypothetical protein